MNPQYDPAIRSHEDPPSPRPAGPVLSVVVPIYGCVDCLEALMRRLHESLDATVPSWEAVLVDDASPDGAWEWLAEAATRDPRVRAIRLSRNFGQHAAITAGLTEARGEWVIVMDCDLQEPPEVIPQLLEKGRAGAEIVLTRRDKRNQSRTRQFLTRAYFKLRNKLLDTEIDTEYSTMSLLSRTVVDAFLSLGDRDRQYMLIVHWLGFNRTVLDLEYSHREAGRSSYTFSKLMKVAVDGMFFQTTKLLRWSMYLGLAFAALGGVLAAAFIALYFVDRPLPGFTSLAVLILIVGGAILTSLGVTGLYVGKIFEQVKGRPLYVVQSRVGAPDDEEDPVVERRHMVAASGEEGPTP